MSAILSDLSRTVPATYWCVFFGDSIVSLAIWQTVSAKLRELLPTERVSHNPMTPGPRVDPELLLSRLSYSHFAELMTLEGQEERAFYEIECVRGAWSVRELNGRSELYISSVLRSHVIRIGLPDCYRLMRLRWTRN
jgi:hypothetical protein